MGDHQRENAAVAIAAALHQKIFPIKESSIESALKKTFWPARLQKITSGKFFKKLPKNCELYLDGSHNLHGVATVKKFLRSQKKMKKFVIFSMVKDKDCAGFLKKISAEIDQLVAVEIPDEARSHDGFEIARIAQNCKIKADFAQNFDEAFEKILRIKKADEDALIMVCGSLYLAGKFLLKNGDS